MVLKKQITDLDSNTLCKGWVQFDGTGTVSITGSFNVSGITDNGTGNYKVNWATDFDNANYCGLAMSNGNQTIVGGILTTGMTVNSLTTGGVLLDSNPIMCAAWGDNAIA